MYSLAIIIYMLAVWLVSPFNKRARMLAIGHLKAFRSLSRQVKPGERYIWFHAASLGEFEQGRPLMERLRREHPELKILLTFFSPSGYEVRKNWEGADVICYLPFDTHANVRAFFHYVQPEMLFLIKYEFWQNYLKACKRRNIPVYSVSSIFRPNQVFFRWYGRFGYVRVLEKITHFFVQNEQSRELLASLGHVDNVTVVGDTRFDRVLDIQAAARPLPLVEKFAGQSSVFIAGSSWQPDESLFIPWFKERLAAHESLRLIIAPHVIAESHLQQIEAMTAPLPTLRYSQATAANVQQARVLIIDCFGLLSSIYRYATVAMVGGGFGVGIHNVPEAAVYGIPVIIGPNNNNFREARHLLDVGGCFEVTDKDSFRSVADRLFFDAEARTQAGRAAGDYIQSNAGASDVIFHQVFH